MDSMEQTASICIGGGPITAGATQSCLTMLEPNLDDLVEENLNPRSWMPPNKTNQMYPLCMDTNRDTRSIC